MQFNQFKKLSGQGNLVPLVLELSADVETPVSSFLKLCRGDKRFLFESMEGGLRWGRYSFLGSEPAYQVRSHASKIEKIVGKKIICENGNSLDYIDQLIKTYRPVATPGLPPFAGGLVGYLGYDMVRQVENLPRYIKKPSEFYDMQLAMYDAVAVYDNLDQKIKLIVMADLTGNVSIAKVYAAAMLRLNKMAARLNQSVKSADKQKNSKIKLSCNTSKARYLAAIAKAKEYILAGDIFQVVLGMRMQGKYSGDAFDVYRKLRRINPSP